MLLFETVSQFLIKKKIPESPSPPMIMFYSITLKSVNTFLRVITNKNGNSLCLIHEYLDLIENVQKSSIKEKELLNYRLNLIEDLRLVIITMLKTHDKKERSLLKQYHSILHLINLTMRRKTSPYSIINEWLNTNHHIEDDEIVLHAIRGNFGKVLRKYPQLRDAIEDLCVLENRLREGKLSRNEYEALKYKWKKQYENQIPSELKDIFCGEYIPSNEHWTDRLCFYLAYNNNQMTFEDALSKISGIDGNDIIANILTKNTKKMLEVSDDWIVLILQFLYLPVSRRNLFDIFNTIGERLIALDWQLSLDYFAFTAFALHHFDSLCESIDMNPILFDSLHRYAIKNEIDKTNLFKTYSDYLTISKNYLLELEFITSCEYYEVELDLEFVEYLLKNYDIVCSYFNEKFYCLNVGKYLTCFIKLFKHQEEPTSEELNLVFESPYTIHLFGLIYELTVKATKHCGRTISKCLDFLYEKEKYLDINKDVMNLYKSEFLKFLCILNKLTKINICHLSFCLE